MGRLQHNYVDDDCGSKTVRASDCELICPSIKCDACKSYRANLRAMYNRWSKHRAVDGSDTSSHTNDRYEQKYAWITCEREYMLQKKR